MSVEIVELELPDGGVVLVRAEQVGEVGDGPTDIGFRDLSFSSVGSTLRGIALEVHDAIKAAQPDTAEVELGLELAVKGSTLVCLLADAEGTASLKVRLEWQKGRRADAAS